MAVLRFATSLKDEDEGGILLKRFVVICGAMKRDEDNKRGDVD